MAFPCPICGAVANTRSSRMISALTKETYYNCSNDNCCHQFKTFEGDPITLALPIKDGQAIPFALIRKMTPSKKKHQTTAMKAETHKPNSDKPGHVIHILAG